MKKFGKYYTDFFKIRKKLEEGKLGPFDKKGIPLVDFNKNLRIYRILLRKNFGIKYFPTVIAQYGLSKFDKFLDTRNEASKREFLQTAQWFKENAKFLPNGAAVIQNFFEFSTYYLKPPWVSAMSQGLAISLLLRAFETTSDHSFLNLAQKILLSFEIPVKKGGCKAVDSKGNIWFEEYPSSPPSFVLNGFIFALLGIHDFYKFSRSVEAKNLFTKGVKSLNQNLYLYDADGWSKYDRIKNLLVNSGYHLLHIQQLKLLSGILKEENLPSSICEKFQRKWENCFNSKFSQIKLIPLKLISKTKQLSRLINLIKS